MTPTGPEGSGQPRKAAILVVDDTEDNLALMSNLLRGEYQVKIALNGAKALAIAQSGKPPDLILLDVMMPGLDGFEVCGQLKDNPATRHIPVIFLTAKSEGEDERKGLELGAVDYITKPISPPIFLARVKNHLALKAMADFLQEQNVELDRALAAAERANEAKSAFLASMSHELRSPLTAILGFGQLMETEQPAPTPTQQENLTQILSAGWHLLTLIDEILDLAKVESGQMAMAQEGVVVSEVLGECLDMVAMQAQTHGIRMVPPNLGPELVVVADRTRLKQVLLNLLSNAIKYNLPEGSVTVTGARVAGGRTRITVKDTGWGLESWQVDQLFQPFNRLSQATGREQGTGIGLVLAKRLVELMGGVIGVASVVEVGSEFWFELPSQVGPDPAGANPGAESAALAQAPGGDQTFTLLYVEDNPASRELVKQIIARQPALHLLIAEDGPAALDRVSASRPDLILMDIDLPGKDGFEVMHMLRALPETRLTPIIAFSANAMPTEIDRGLRAGFDHYLTKPFKIGALMALVNRTLGLAPGSPEGIPC